MIGSPDLLAFTGTEGFGDDGVEVVEDVLPEELSVPLFPSADPWSTAAHFHRDFILVAEFSEQVGPQPLLTIPDDPRVLGTFDLNHFSVRLMSVDYQASCPGPTAHYTMTGAGGGPRLSFSEDSRVVLGDSADGAFAYVHHLTLYDLEARGMVRPFCMAYVSSDQDKLMHCFLELSACFSRASDSLKTGNRRAFAKELQRRLQELEYKRLTLQRAAELQPPAAADTDEFMDVGDEPSELAAVEHSILDHRELLRQVTSYPNRKLKQPDFLPYDPSDSLADPPGTLTPSPCPSPPPSSSPPRRFERRLKPLEELSDAYFLTLTLEQLADTERRLRGAHGALHTARLTRTLSRRLELTNFLFDLWPRSEQDCCEEDDERERDARELSSDPRRSRGGARECLEVPLVASPASLDSFHSCVEEIPIKMEAAEEEEGDDEGSGSASVTPDPDVAIEMMMTGSVSSGDSIEVLGTERSYRTQQAVYETSAGMFDTSARRALPAAVEAGTARHAVVQRASARRANSEDSIEVLSTTESIVPDDLTAITEEEAEEHQLDDDGGFLDAEEQEEEEEEEESMEELRTGGNDGQREEEEEEPVQRMESPGEREESAQQRTVGNEVREDGCQRVPTVPELHVNVAPPATTTTTTTLLLPEVSLWPPPSRFAAPPLRLLSVDEEVASDCASFTSSSEPTSLSSSHNRFHHHRRGQRTGRRRRAALRALRFLQQNSFSQHAVFCLLSGRPLVVLGGDESAVRKLVDALALFVPAPGGPEGADAVLPCLTAPLQLTDLLAWRLIGVHRSSSTSSCGVLNSLARYARYVAVLDLDQRTLRCPSYQGSVVKCLAVPHSSIYRGSTYLLHLESCLTALAGQALLHTFTSSSSSSVEDLLHAPLHQAGKEEEEEDDVRAQRRRRSQLLLEHGGFCGSDDDLRVMRFLSDLIRVRHVGSVGPPVLSFSYSPVQLHRNTTAPT